MDSRLARQFYPAGVRATSANLLGRKERRFGWPHPSLRDRDVAVCAGLASETKAAGADGGLAELLGQRFELAAPKRLEVGLALVDRAGARGADRSEERRVGKGGRG